MSESVLDCVTKLRLKGIEFSRMEPQLPKDVDATGLYVHIPFCRIPCPYCPYNRYPWQPNGAQPYVEAVEKEIKLYSEELGDTAVNSLYFGGGTPTIMPRGISHIIAKISETFEVKGDVCTEANPDDLDEKTLDLLLDSGVTKLSIGVQSFKDHILKSIGRMSHDGKTAANSIKAALTRDFDCVNVDLMFSLPEQTLSDLEEDLKAAVEMGVPQITTYPLLLFPYTKIYQGVKQGTIRVPDAKKERKMYETIVNLLTEAGYEPCSVWSFTKQGTSKFGSVEREEYVGLGAGAASRIGSITYWNTFPIDEYVRALDKGLPVAVGSKQSQKALMMQWFMMRLYETKVNKGGFSRQFGVDMDEALKWPLRALRFLGVIRSDADSVTITREGMYPVHAMMKTFLSTYIGRICEECMKTPWPDHFRI